MNALTALPNSKRPLGLISMDNPPFNFLSARINYADVATHTTTYNIFDLPARSFVVFAWLVVETLFVGATATVLIDESTGSGSIFSATDTPVADLTAGSVIKAVCGDAVGVLNTVAGHDDEYDTAARTIDWTTGTASFTAGEGVLIVVFLTLPA